MRYVKYIVIHCTATAQSTTIESIKSYWKNKLGWKSYGYHKIIDLHGRVTELATPDKVTNGVRGYNSTSYHISYIGGKDIDDRTYSQRKTLLKEIRKAKKLFPKAQILGHRDLSPDLNRDGKITSNEWVKLCPQFNVKEWCASFGLR